MGLEPASVRASVCASVRASTLSNMNRVAMVREKFWKRELHFQSGKFKKNEKSHGKVREFQNFPKKMLVNRPLEILVSIICKQY